MEPTIAQLNRRMLEMGWSLKDLAKRVNAPSFAVRKFLEGTFYHTGLALKIAESLGFETPRPFIQGNLASQKCQKATDTPSRNNFSSILNGAGEEISMKTCP